MNVTLKQAFCLLDGRLSTSMDDVHNMLNFIFSANLYTHQLPAALDKLKEENPKWFSDGVLVIESIKHEIGTDDFQRLMDIIDDKYSSFIVKIEKL